MGIRRRGRRGAAATGTATTIAMVAGLFQSGCAPTERGELWEGEVRDSAGVTIVVNEGPDRRGDEAPWRVETGLRIDSVFGHVVDVAVDGQGRVYVLDQMAREVRIFSAEGQPEGRLGGPGEGPGELSGFATSVVLAGDTVLVADWAEARVNRYLRDGTVLPPGDVPGEAGSRSWWAAGPDSTRWVRALRRWRDEDNRWRGTDVLFRLRPGERPDSVLTFTYQESDLGSPDQPKVPLIVNAPSWAILPGGGVVWTATDREELRIHGADGGLRSIVRRPAWRRRPVTDEDHRTMLELLGEKFEMMGSTADFVERLDIARHEVLPALTAVRAGPRGTIWVRRMGDPRLIHPMALNSPDHPDWMGGHSGTCSTPRAATWVRSGSRRRCAWPGSRIAPSTVSRAMPWTWSRSCDSTCFPRPTKRAEGPFRPLDGISSGHPPHHDPPEAPMPQIAIDPTNGREIARYDETGADELHAILDAAVETQRSWADLSVDDRAGPMRGAASVLRDRKAEWAELMTREMGKTLASAEAEVEKCAWVCEYYADNAADFLAPVSVETDADRSYWTHRPLGVVLAVMPWNFPFWQVFRFAAPNLMAGNAGLLSHSENVPGCSLAIEEVLHEAGIPSALFRSLLIDNDATGDLLDDGRVRAATVTGSVGAGRAIAERAGRNLKTTVLELGGSDPYLVLSDADVPRAAAACATSRLINAGQSCIAAKRMIVDAAVYDDFMEHFVARMEEAVVGDPMEAATDIGPMAREDLRDGLHDQVVRSVDAGATLVLGGEIPERDGWWYPATVLTDVQPGMAAYEEELFGPVATVLRAHDEEDAIRIANDTEFGLGAAVFTRDVRRGERIAAERIEAGCCFVNAFVRSDPRLPFGGVKNSGYGRELSPLGIREFVNQKTVWIDP